MSLGARVRSLAALIFLVVSANAYGQGATQASITGVVRDASGAPLPGVTVEASSPVLIENSRSSVTDGAGRYQVVGLFAGAYTVTYLRHDLDESDIDPRRQIRQSERAD